MNSVVTTYYFAGGSYEVQENGVTETVRKYYSFAGMAIAMQSCTAADCSLITANWTLVYFLTDHLGSIAAVTSDSGALLSEQRYLPFGEVREDVGEITQTDFGFTGQRALDQQGNAYSLGLMDYNARFYSSSLGRFISADTIVPGGGPQMLNRYSYVYNNPILFMDPTGHQGCADLPTQEAQDACFNTAGQNGNTGGYVGEGTGSGSTSGTNISKPKAKPCIGSDVYCQLVITQKTYLFVKGPPTDSADEYEYRDSQTAEPLYVIPKKAPGYVANAVRANNALGWAGLIIDLFGYGAYNTTIPARIWDSYVYAEILTAHRLGSYKNVTLAVGVGNHTNSDITVSAFRFGDQFYSPPANAIAPNSFATFIFPDGITTFQDVPNDVHIWVANKNSEGSIDYNGALFDSKKIFFP